MGTKSGAKKAVATIYAKFNQDFFRRVGAWRLKMRPERLLHKIVKPRGEVGNSEAVSAAVAQ